MMIDTAHHSFCAICHEWTGWFSNAAVAADTAKWEASRFPSGARRLRPREWRVFDAGKRRFVCEGRGMTEKQD